MFTRQPTSLAAAFLALSALSLPAVSQEASDAPPPLLKGGIVHQLRSLTDEAMDALKPGERGEASATPAPSQFSRSGAPQKPGGVAPFQRSTSDPASGGAPTEEPTDAVPSLLARAGSILSRGLNRPAADNEPDSAATPRLAPPQRVRSRPLSDPPSLDPPQSDELRRQPGPPSVPPMGTSSTAKLRADAFGDVHVEEELPSAILRSFSDTSYVTPDRESESKAGSPSGSTSSDRSPAPVNRPPRVSRIPLPGSVDETAETPSESVATNDHSTDADAKSTAVASSPTATRSDAEQPAARTPASEQPATQQPAPKLMASRSLSDGGPTAPAPASSSPALPAVEAAKTNTSVAKPTPTEAKSTLPEAKSSGSVSVPTSLVARPTSEQSPLALPPSATAKLPSTASQPLLPTLPPLATTNSAPATAQGNPPTTLAPQMPPPPSVPSLESLAQPAAPADATRLNKVAADQPQAPGQPARVASPVAAADLERLRMETPRLEVVLEGPSDLPVGSASKFKVLVHNRDGIDLEGLVLRLDVPPGVVARSLGPTHGSMAAEQAGDGATLFTWTFENLRGGKSAIAPLELTASTPRNFAVAMEWTLFPIAGAADIDVRAANLELALEGPSEVTFGEANTYRLHLRNSGNAPAEDVQIKLSAEPYGTSSSQIGTIAAGGEEVIDVELTFNQQGVIHIAALADAAGDLSSQTKIDVLVRQPNLVAEVVAPNTMYHGLATEYLLRITNTGDAPARDVVARCALPPGATPTGLPPGITHAQDQLSWNIAELAAGAVDEVALQVNLTRPGDNEFKLDCAATGGSACRASASTYVEAIVDLKLMVDDPVAPAPVGGEVVYELTLTNRGSKAANNVQVVAQFSEGIEPTRGLGHASRIIPGQLLFEPIRRVEAGQTIVLKVFAQAESSGTHRFRAEVRSADSELKLVQEESTQFLESIGRVAAPPTKRTIR